MAINVGDAVLMITGDTTGLDKALTDTDNKVSSAMGNVGKSVKEVQSPVSNLAGLFSSLLPAIGVAGIISGLQAILTEGAAAGDSLVNMSIRTGIATDALQRLGYAAELGGGSLASMESIIRYMQSAIGGAIQGVGNMGETFKKLGLSVRELQSLSPDQQFYRIAEAVEAIPDPSEKVRAYREIFGRAGTDVAVYVQNLEAAGRLPILTQEQINNLAAGNQAMEVLGISWGQLSNSFAATIWPNFIPFIDSIATAVRWIGELSNSLKEMGKWGEILSILIPIPGARNFLTGTQSFHGFEGIIPGIPGTPIPAIVHAGEYIGQGDGPSRRITNNFNGPYYIREEADIQKVARELYRLQQLRGTNV
jgi:hypothetical protein